MVMYLITYLQYSQVIGSSEMVNAFPQRVDPRRMLVTEFLLSLVYRNNIDGFTNEF